MNALKSYSSEEDSDTCSKPSKQVKDGDPGTNYDSVGMDISEDSDEERPKSYESSKPQGHKCYPCKSNESMSHTSTVKTEKNISSRHSVENRECSSGSSRDSRENKDHSSRDDRHNDRRRKRDHHRERDRRDGDRRRGDHDRRSGDYHRYGRDRSRSRERRYRRSRSSERRRRSRSYEKRKPDTRRDAQMKLAALKAADPNFDQSYLLRQSMVEQIAEVEKQTGVTLPTYYNPATMNPLKLAEQERKKRLLWGNKNKPQVEEVPAVVSASCSGNPDMQEAIWANTRFNNDNDGKMAQKFKRLMGVKAPEAGPSFGPTKSDSDLLKKQESLFVSMEKQYETARMVTHANKGFGLGFSSQPFVPKQ